VVSELGLSYKHEIKSNMMEYIAIKGESPVVFYFEMLYKSKTIHVKDCLNIGKPLSKLK